MPGLARFRTLFGRLFTGGEERLFKECAKILLIARDANAALTARPGRALDIAAIRRLEQQADDEKFRIANVIASGAVAPNVLDNMLSLLAREDDIVNAIYNLARESSRYGVRNGEEDRYIQEQIAAVSRLVDSAVDTLLQMSAQDDLTTLRTLRQTIERLEETATRSRTPCSIGRTPRRRRSSRSTIWCRWPTSRTTSSMGVRIPPTPC